MIGKKYLKCGYTFREAENVYIQVNVLYPVKYHFIVCYTLVYVCL